MDEFQKMAVTIAIKRMFTSDYFNISVLDNCIKIVGCIPDKKDYDTLRALHCVHWGEMPQSLREMVMLKTAQILNGPQFDTNALIEGLFVNDSPLLN